MRRWSMVLTATRGPDSYTLGEPNCIKGVTTAVVRGLIDGWEYGEMTHIATALRYLAAASRRKTLEALEKVGRHFLDHALDAFHVLSPVYFEVLYGWMLWLTETKVQMPYALMWSDETQEKYAKAMGWVLAKRVFNHAGPPEYWGNLFEELWGSDPPTPPHRRLSVNCEEAKS